MGDALTNIPEDVPTSDSVKVPKAKLLPSGSLHRSPPAIILTDSTLDIELYKRSWCQEASIRKLSMEQFPPFSMANLSFPKYKGVLA